MKQIGGPWVEKILKQALAEDAGRGDVTTALVVEDTAKAKGTIVAKEAGIVAGLPLAGKVFQILDQFLEFTPLAMEGEEVKVGRIVATVEGTAWPILTGERTALNFLQHLSGVATLTAKAVGILAEGKTRLLDTRKTTPGLRCLEKYAVRVGGGNNHRFALDDLIMIKDNHIILAGGVGEAVRRAKLARPRHLKIQVEVGSMPELEEALAGGVDFILLDNMDEETLTKAVVLTKGRVPLEASGGVTLENLGRVAATGVDYVSMGLLTNSAKALDFSLRIQGK